MKNVIAGLEAILFDMDGTLVNSTHAVEKCWSEWAIRQGLSVNHVLDFIHGRPARDSVRALAPNANEEVEVAWMLSRELHEHEGVVEIPGARDFLTSLMNFPWAIVTSADRELAIHRLKIAGIPIPKVFVTVNDVVKGKPDPEGYLKAAKALGANPKNCLVAEDAPAGLEAGRRAGMKLLGITTTLDSAKLGVEFSTKNYLTLKFDHEAKSLTI